MGTSLLLSMGALLKKAVTQTCTFYLEKNEKIQKLSSINSGEQSLKILMAFFRLRTILNVKFPKESKLPREKHRSIIVPVIKLYYTFIVIKTVFIGIKVVSQINEIKLRVQR